MNTSRDDAEFDPFAHGKGGRKGAGSSAGPAWLALLLALAVAGWNGYQWWLERAEQDRGDNLQQTVSSVQAQQADLQRNLAALQSRVAAAEQDSDEAEWTAVRAELEALQARVSAAGVQAVDAQAQIDAAQAALLALQQRLDGIENSVAALAARQDTPGRRMEIAEVGQLLRLAEERLDLFGDVRSADAALAHADARLEAMDDPLYLPVRRRIAESRQALAAVPLPDVPALAASLSALQDSVAGLPFEGEARREQALDPIEEDRGFWQRIKSALTPLVTVRRRVDEDSLVSLEDRDFIRQGLWMQLESARLALMRGDAQAWQLSLHSVRDTLTERYDGRSARVADAVARVDELLATPLQAEMPDIGTAWAQLRLLREGTTAAAAGEAAGADAADPQEPPETSPQEADGG